MIVVKVIYPMRSVGSEKVAESSHISHIIYIHYQINIHELIKFTKKEKLN